jgi:protein-L-isoaspartate(D-aspartate) O-methyltransferase
MPSEPAKSMNRIEAHRAFFAKLITTQAGLPADSPVAAAFASTPREDFLGPGPWRVFAVSRSIETPSDDAAFLYQDVTVAISPERGINNGQPTLHALCLGALQAKEGEHAIHIGAGTGYYTALLAKLVGPTGSVTAYEIEPDLAERATNNLLQFPNVKVEPHSGSEGELPPADVIYVSAGATAPLHVWLDALRENGRLLFPLTPHDSKSGAPGVGGMLLIKRLPGDQFTARFLCQAMFIPCAGAREDGHAEKLAEAFRKGGLGTVRTLKRNSKPDSTCWVAGADWWLSTADNAAK